LETFVQTDISLLALLDFVICCGYYYYLPRGSAV